ncbi:ABC transporter permease [Candidimonas nitroreducens]|uniref:Iron ABC transporter permease n=1 Tax=Candidimonas nitroreducens TaxID=683354 RepID=A0A225LXR1_9BURK|nr:iron ABC transporter permease [Candidimonas nitroreducens]OWT53938.1 iron ABC transporter permease [Candidimonas nitroreducens]
MAAIQGTSSVGRKTDARKWLALALLTLLLVLVVPTVFILIRTSLAQAQGAGGHNGLTLSNYLGLFGNPRLAAAFTSSIIFAIGSSILALVVGGILAWLVERTNVPFKILAHVTAVVSMGTPYVLYIIAWLFLLGHIGPINTTWRALGFNGDLIHVNSMAGMILIEGFLWSPLVFLMLSANFRSANADMEEAARMSGASVLKTVWHISIKLAVPAIIALAMFVFIRAIEAFEVPLLVGTPSGIQVLTTEVYESMKVVPPQLGQSAAFSVILLVFVGILFSLYGRLSKNADKYQSVTGKAFRPRPFDLGSARWIAGTLVLVYFLIVLLLPILALVWMSLVPYASGVSMRIIPYLNGHNYAALWQAPQYFEYGLNTVIVAAGAATIVVALTSFAAWISARRGPYAWGIDQLATAPLIFPGIVMGVAILQIFLNIPVPVYGTLWIILFAYILRYLPYGMRYNYSGVLQIHRELEEAAQVSGATIMGTFRRIIAPLLTPSATAAWIFIFLICAKELALAVLLSGPRSKVLAVAMLDLWANGQTGELAALGLAWTLVMTILAMLAFWLSQRSRMRAFG